jgi:carbon storage regulator
MLTLTRSVGETIRIGDDIEVHVVEVRGGTVRLGFKAPREVAIHREEVYRQIAEANLLAAQVTADSLGALAAFAPSATAGETAEQLAGEAPGDSAEAPAGGQPAAAPEAAEAGGRAADADPA